MTAKVKKTEVRGKKIKSFEAQYERVVDRMLKIRICSNKPFDKPGEEFYSKLNNVIDYALCSADSFHLNSKGESTLFEILEVTGDNLEYVFGLLALDKLHEPLSVLIDTVEAEFLAVIEQENKLEPENINCSTRLEDRAVILTKLRSKLLQANALLKCFYKGRFLNNDGTAKAV